MSDTVLLIKSGFEVGIEEWTGKNPKTVLLKTSTMFISSTFHGRYKFKVTFSCQRCYFFSP